ncbi:putative methyltransferase-domain-containing protein [Rhodotorula diobovata]|uniref:25S rRNA adenine-N(1) methyltransferase n=1 Tax=Rhodotorula diobovata TaxID=5288 RepID=A0A5C5FYM6_9BASI|nr:putative methyltransferase-domain-containing protein [Rhodotorula diobovata]
MPHTNNLNGKSRPFSADRKAKRAGRKPAFLAKKPKSSKTPSAKDAVVGPAPAAAASSDPSIPRDRTKQTELIRAFHAIEKQLASPALTDPAERKKLEDERERLGGLAEYQRASVHGGDAQRGGESSKWLVKQIKELKIGVDSKDKDKANHKVEPTILEDGTKVWPKVERKKLRLLDIGAIAGTAYAGYPWISATSIDLNPQAPHVVKSNFFDFAPPQKDEDKYDVVALSLVVNFEGSLVNRGHMLLHAHQYLTPRGYLYLVLPLPCLTNSRYLSHERLTSILASTGWDVVRKHDSARLTYWLVRRSEDGPDGKEWKREQVRKGAGRNNFVIVVKPGAPIERGVAPSRDGTETEAATADEE